MNMLRNVLMNGVAYAPPGEAGAGAGAGAGAAGAGAGAAGAGAGAPGTGAGAAGAGAGAGDGAGAGAAAPWYGAFNLEKPASDYIEAKGIKDVNGLLKIAQDFEAVARDRNVIAKPDASDPAKLAEWEGWETLGWVKDPTKYAPKKPELKQGQYLDEGIFNSFAKTAHELRVPLPMAEQLYGRMFATMSEQVATLQAAQAQEQKAALDTALTGLKSEWGANYDANIEKGKRAMAALGVAKQADELEKIVGTPSLIKLFADLGDKLGEDVLKGGGGGGNQPGPAQARAERQALQADPEFMRVFNDQRDPQHEAFVAKRQKLLDIEAKGGGR